MGDDGRLGMTSFSGSASRAASFYGSGSNHVSLPKRLRSSRSGRRQAKVVGLLVAFAAMILVASSVALAPPSKGKALPEPELPAGIAKQPPPPFWVQGQIFDEFGSPVTALDTEIIIKNMRTLATNTTDLNMPAFGYYEFNLNFMAGGWLDGDPINITASSVSLGLWGQNEAPLVEITGYLLINVVVYPTVIPEFPMLFVPIVGMMALVVVVNLRRRGEGP